MQIRTLGGSLALPGANPEARLDKALVGSIKAFEAEAVVVGIVVLSWRPPHRHRAFVVRLGAAFAGRKLFGTLGPSEFLAEGS